MTRPTQQLNNEDALLLAYVTGELAGEELAEVQRRLDADAMLPPRMRQLRRDYSAVMEQMQLLDDTTAAGNAEAALRQVDRLLVDWQHDRIVRRPAQVIQHDWHVPRWAYAAAAMVALLIGFCFWWANNSPPDGAIAVLPSVSVGGLATPAPDATEPLPPEQMPLAFQNPVDENAEELSDLEQDVVALSHEGLSINNFTSDNSQ